MRKDLTELVFILDRSGSMSGLESDAVGGFNSMIEKQSKEDGEALVSTVLFNHEMNVVHDRIDIKETPKMEVSDYKVGGSTALIDAIGSAIHHISNVHKYIREEDRPEHTIFLIMTDGYENASHRYSSDDVKRMITEKQELGWEFIFMAANIDAVETAKTIGIKEDYSVNYINDSEGIAMNMCVMEGAIKRMRKGKKLDADWKAEAEADFSKRK